jgi:hypothetical protein
VGGVFKNHFDVVIETAQFVFPKHFGKAGPYQFFFAFMQINAAMLINQIADPLKLAVRQFPFF